MLNDGFKSVPKWPTYQTAFLALENFLKAFLLLKGATLEPGHDLRALLKEAEAKGLVLKVPPTVEEAVMRASEYYPDGSSGEWTQVYPHLVISFADQVRRDARF
jgi:HEPN domain-containing protein